MSDQTVTIDVNQTGRGSAVKDAASEIRSLNAEIQKLNQASQAYSARGMDDAAKSARVDAAGLQRQVRSIQQQAQRATDLDDRRGIFSDQLKAKEMRAQGNESGATALEKEVAIRQRAIQLEKTLGIDRQKATELAAKEAAAVEAHENQKLASSAVASLAKQQAVQAQKDEDRTLVEDKVSVQRLRNNGHGTQADALEKDIALRERSSQLERRLGISPQDARKLAGEEMKVQEAAKAKTVGERRGQHGDELRVMELRANGSNKEAQALERQIAIRSRALQLERDLVISRGEATALAEREAKAQSSAQKNSGGGLLGMFGGWRGIASSGATAGLQLVNSIMQFRTESAQRSTAIAAQGIEGANQTTQTMGIGGVRGESKAASEYTQARGELEALTAQRGTFAGHTGGPLDQFKNGMKNRFGINIGETEEDRLNRELEEKIARKQTDVALKGKASAQKFRDGTGMMGIQQQEAINQGHMKEAYQLQDSITWLEKYNQVLEQSGGSVAMATRAADAKMTADQKERAGALLGTIDWRTSAAAASRIGAMAVDIAGGKRPEQLTAAIAKLNKDVNGNHQKATNTATQKNFVRP